MPTITKTIGSGGDYATIQLWYDGINTDAGGTNLVSLGVVAIGKVIGNLTGTTVLLDTTSTAYTTDSTHTITLTSNSAESYSAGLNWSTSHGPSITSSVNGNTLNITQSNFIISNLQIQNTGNGIALQTTGNPITLDSLVIMTTSGGWPFETNNNAGAMKNCVVYGNSVGNTLIFFHGADATVCSYCTFACGSDNGALSRVIFDQGTTAFTDCCFFVGGNTATFNDGGGAPTYTNCATDFVGPPSGTAWQSSLTYASQFQSTTVAGVLDFRALSTGGLKHGTPVSGITTDINGTTRDGTTPYIGAWEVASAGALCGSRALIGVGCGIALARKLEENPILTRRGLLLPRRRSLIGHNGGPPLDE